MKLKKSLKMKCLKNQTGKYFVFKQPNSTEKQQSVLFLSTKYS